MLSFSVEFKPGVPIYEQVVFAVKKAIVQGQIKPGDRFPSVREISKELKINPNTTQKIISQLVAENLLTIEPGKGSVVCRLQPASSEQIKETLHPQIEQLVVEAKRLSVHKEDVITSIEQEWSQLDG